MPPVGLSAGAKGSSMQERFGGTRNRGNQAPKSRDRWGKESTVEGQEGRVARCCRAMTKEEMPAPLQGSSPRWEPEDGNMKWRGRTPCAMKGSNSQSWKLKEKARHCERCWKHPSQHVPSPCFPLSVHSGGGKEGGTPSSLLSACRPQCVWTTTDTWHSREGSCRGAAPVSLADMCES